VYNILTFGSRIAWVTRTKYIDGYGSCPLRYVLLWQM